MIPWFCVLREEVGAPTSFYPGWSQLLQVKNIPFALTDTLTDNHVTKRNRQGRYKEWEQQNRMHCCQVGWSNCVGWHSYESCFIDKEHSYLMVIQNRASNLGKAKKKFALGVLFVWLFFLIENCRNVVLLKWRIPVSCIHVLCHISYIHCLISHIIYHISYIHCLISCILYHISYVIYHISCIQCSMSSDLIVSCMRRCPTAWLYPGW